MKLILPDTGCTSCPQSLQCVCVCSEKEISMLDLGVRQLLLCVCSPRCVSRGGGPVSVCTVAGALCVHSSGGPVVRDEVQTVQAEIRLIAHNDQSSMGQTGWPDHTTRLNDVVKQTARSRTDLQWKKQQLYV